MARFVSDVLRTMRLVVSRRNASDPDSSDDTLLRYVNDFVSLTMSDDIRLFEQTGTLTFQINEDNETGVYTFNNLGATGDFVSITAKAFISLTDPPAGSLSWTPLSIYQDPGEFYSHWGVENEDVLIHGMPTQMLFYGNEFVFRTIPDTDYTVNIYGYKKQEDFSSVGNPVLPHDYWMRYIAYGAALNYAMDFRFADNIIAGIKKDYKREKKLMLTHNHNQIKQIRGFPSF